VLVKAFAGLNWLSIEKGYNDWSRTVEILSITTHVDREGMMQLLAVYREQGPGNPARVN